MHKQFILLFILALALLSFSNIVSATTVTVTTAAELISAINVANAQPDHNTINIANEIVLTSVYVPSTVTGNTGLSYITSPITINGNGNRIRRDPAGGLFRIFLIGGTGALVLKDITISVGSPTAVNEPGNGLTDAGGAIYQAGGTLTINNSLIAGNLTTRGGGIFQAAGSLIINNSEFENSANTGGSIHSEGGSLTIMNSSFANNLTSGNGAALYLNSNDVNISNSTFYGNGPIVGVITGNGGAIYIEGGNVNIVNSTFLSNLANQGSAIYNNGSLTMTNVTIANNIQEGGAAVHNTAAGTISLNNTILMDNLDLGSLDPNLNCENAGGTFNTDSFNLFGYNNDSGGCPAGASDIVPSVNFNAIYDPNVTDGSGPTVVYPLIANSPAIDSANAANCPFDDQRGVQRGIDGNGTPNNPQTGDCDIGAFEFGSAATYPTISFDTASASYNELDGTVQISLSLSGASSNFAGIAEFTISNPVGTASSGSDYAVIPSTSFTVNCAVLDCTSSIPLSIPITINMDAVHPEADETLILSIASTNGFVNIGAIPQFTATIVSIGQPIFSKIFTLDTIGVGEISTLTFTIDNTGNAVAASNLDFTDNFPAELFVAASPNASTTCTGGTLTALAGSSSISYTGGSLNANEICTIQVDVSSSIAAVYLNTSNDLSSSLGNSGSASASLSVEAETVLFSKSFVPAQIIVNQISTLVFTLDNSANAVAATNIDFTDNLPADLFVAPSPNASTTCTGGTLTAIAGSSVISYTGGIVGASSSCTIEVDVSSAIVASYTNISEDLTSNFGNSGSATASLIVSPVGTVIIPPNNTSPNSIGGSSTTSGGIDVFDPAISKLGVLVPGQLGITGEALEWIVTVSNTGAIVGNNVIVTDTLNPALRIDSVNAPNATVSINGQTVSVTYASLQVGETQQFSIFTTVLNGATVDNTACVTASNQGAEECATALPISQLPNTGETPLWAYNMMLGLGVLSLTMLFVLLKRKSALSQN